MTGKNPTHIAWDLGVGPSWSTVKIDVVNTPGIDKVIADALAAKIAAQIDKDMWRMMMQGRPPQYDFDPPTPPLTARVEPSFDQRTIHVGYQLSVAQLHAAHNVQDIFESMKRQVAVHMAQEVTRRMMDGHYDDLIKSAIKDAIRDTVKKAVEARTEEFIEEMLS